MDIPITPNPDGPEVARLVYASFFKRWVAYSLDSLLLIVITFSVSILAINWAGASVMDLTNFGVIFWLIVAFHMAATIGYFTIFTFSGGATPSKMLMGIKVADSSGVDISFKASLLRAIGYYISGFFLYIGFLIMLVDIRYQTFHDKIAGSVVVKTR